MFIVVMVVPVVVTVVTVVVVVVVVGDGGGGVVVVMAINLGHPLFKRGILSNTPCETHTPNILIHELTTVINAPTALATATVILIIDTPIVPTD